MDKYLKMKAIGGLMIGMQGDLWHLEETFDGEEYALEPKKQEIIETYFNGVKDIVNENSGF